MVRFGHAVSKLCSFTNILRYIFVIEHLVYRKTRNKNVAVKTLNLCIRYRSIVTNLIYGTLIAYYTTEVRSPPNRRNLNYLKGNYETLKPNRLLSLRKIDDCLKNQWCAIMKGNGNCRWKYYLNRGKARRIFGPMVIDEIGLKNASVDAYFWGSNSCYLRVS